MSLDITLHLSARTGIGDQYIDVPVFEANITHNLNSMAREANIYFEMWRPEEINVKSAGDLIYPLRKGLELLKAKPEHFKKFDPGNGWGDYNNFINRVEDYLKACEMYPAATVSTDR